MASATLAAHVRVRPEDLTLGFYRRVRAHALRALRRETEAVRMMHRPLENGEFLIEWRVL